MTEKSSLVQVVQVGVESVPGTNVPADKLLQSVSIEPAIKAEVNAFRPAGKKWPTVAVHNREWVEAKITAQPTYAELPYLFASVLDAPTITTPGGTTPRLWTFDLDAFAADAPKTYSVECGESGAGNASEFSYGIITSLDLKFSRESIEVSGTMMGQRLTTGATLTGTPTSMAVVPISPNQVSVYLDDTAAGLGGTKLTRDFSVGISVGDRFSPVWPIDAANTSWAAHVEGEPKGEVTLLMAADSVGMGLLATMRAGSSKFLRVKAVGPVIETTYYYEMTLDMALKVTNVSEFKDEDGVYAIEWTFAVVYDATWTRALLWTVQNTQTAM